MYTYETNKKKSSNKKLTTNRDPKPVSAQPPSGNKEAKTGRKSKSAVLQQ